MHKDYADSNHGRAFVTRLDNWGELLDECSQPPIGNYDSSKQTYDTKWTETRSYDEAMVLARDGWKEGIAKADVLSRAITTKMGSMIRKMHLRPDVEGCAFDVGAIVTNEPECWIRPQYKIQKGNSAKIIRICVNVSASAGVPTSVMIARGSVAVALIRLLEQSGKRVEVFVMDSAENRGSGERYEHYVLIKRADQALDLARMIFACADPSMLRRVMFRLYERMPAAFQSNFFGYGSPCEAIHFPEDKKPDILIGHAHLHDVQWSSESSAIAWIKEKLVEQGVKVI